MELRWLGESCVAVRSADTTVLCDPYTDGAMAASVPLEADIVTLSTGRWPAVPLRPLLPQPRFVRGPGEYELHGVVITGVAMPRADDRGQNTVYLIELGGVTICHLGYLDRAPTASMLQAIGAVDLLLIPFSGAETLTAAQAAEVVSEIEPRVVVPLILGAPTDAEALTPFYREMGVPHTAPQRRLTVAKSGLPDTLQVAALTVEEPQAEG